MAGSKIYLSYQHAKVVSTNMSDKNVEKNFASQKKKAQLKKQMSS